MKTHACKICGEQVVLECFDYDDCDNNNRNMNTESKCLSCALNLKEESCSECVAENDYEIHLGYPHAEECDYYAGLVQAE